MSSRTSPKRAGALPAEATLLTTAAVPSTTAVVTAVTGAALGADYVLGKMFGLGGFEAAVIVFALLLSGFATLIAHQLPFWWRVALWPFNFCFLVYLVISSAFFLDSVNKQNKQGQSPPGTSHAVEQRILPGGGQR